MATLTTNPIPGFFGQYGAVVPKTKTASFVAVGITPGQAWANAKIALSVDSNQLQQFHEIIRISEKQYRTAVAPSRP
jgi:hypothetical protein